MPPALQERLGVEATANLLELFDTARQEWTADVTTAAVERFERRLTEEIGALRGEMRDSDNGLRLEIRDLGNGLRAEIRELGGSLRTEIVSLRADNLEGRFELMKWSFAFWIGQVFAVGGIMALMLRLMRP